jgi:hypothetical protein
MRTEAELRRPDFTGGTPVRLADGNEWSIPRPVIRISPRLDDAGKVAGLSARTTFGAEFDDLIRSIQEPPEGANRVTLLLTLAVDLLDKNYTLTPEEKAEVLTFDMGDEAGEQMLFDVYDVAVGNGPKASNGG